METKKKNLLLVAYFYPPVGGKGLPGAQRMVKFVRYIQKFQPWILTILPDRYPDFFATDNPTPLPIADERIEYAGTFDIFSWLFRLRNWFRSGLKATSEATAEFSENQSKNNSIGSFQRIKDLISGLLTFPDYGFPWIFPAICKGRKIIRRHDVRAIFATGTPWASLMVGWGLKRLTGAKLIVDFRDPWVDNPFSSPKAWILKRMEYFFERKIVSDSDLVSLNTEPLREAFIRRYPYLPSDRFITLPNGYDSHDFEGVVSLNDQNKYTEKRNQLLIGHAGSLYGLRDPRPLLEAMDLLRREKREIGERINFHQIGDVELTYNLHEWVAKRNFIDQFSDQGSLPHQECINRMMKLDILMIIQQDTMTQIPSKLYEYILLGKPILTIASKNGALGRIIREYGFGEIYAQDDIAEIASYLWRMWNIKAEKGFLEADYSQRDHFDVRRITQELEKHIETLG